MTFYTRPMDVIERAIETTGVIDEGGRLHLDESLPASASQEVRVILLPVSNEDLTERAWLRSAARNPAFDVLHDPEEDRYHPTDGRPFSEGD